MQIVFITLFAFPIFFPKTVIFLETKTLKTKPNFPLPTGTNKRPTNLWEANCLHCAGHYFNRINLLWAGWCSCV